MAFLGIPAPSETALFDPTTLLRRVSGNMDLLRECTEIFAAEAPILLAKIEDAIQRGSAEELQHASHQLKGSTLQLSAPKATAAARTLEEMGRNGTLSGAKEAVAKLKIEIALLLEAITSWIGPRPNGCTLQ